MNHIFYPDTTSLDPERLSAERAMRLPQSDRILLEDPRFAPLHALLAQNGRASPQELSHYLNYPMPTDGFGLINFLVETNLITSEQMRTAKERRVQGRDKPLGHILADMGLLGEVAEGLAYALRFNLDFHLLAAQQVEAEAVSLLSAEQAVAWSALPVSLSGDTLLLALTDPTRVAEGELAGHFKRPLRLCITTPRILAAAHANWYADSDAQLVTHFHSVVNIDPTRIRAGDDPDMPQAVTLVDQLLLNAIERGASDIHITPEERHLSIRFRVDGCIEPHARLRNRTRNALISRLKVLCGMDISEKRLPQDGALRIRMLEKTLDVRVSCVPSVLGETLVLRLLDHEKRMMDLSDLGFYGDDRQRIWQAVTRPYGMILVTGPTGSGKSTSLAAALRAIQQTGEKHILTVEDPVEVRMQGITQVQVNNKSGFTFARALRHFLRHDPDVVMVGEIRDVETARIAVQSALTGHMVLSTLHTNDAFGAVNRLVDMGVESYLVSSAVTLVVAQRLVRTICAACRTPHAPTATEQAFLQRVGVRREIGRLYSGAGCRACDGSGYKGQTVIYEILFLDEALKGLIASGANASQLREAARGHFRPLLQCGLRKAVEGVTTLKEVAVYLEMMADGG